MREAFVFFLGIVALLAILLALHFSLFLLALTLLFLFVLFIRFPKQLFCWFIVCFLIFLLSSLFHQKNNSTTLQGNEKQVQVLFSSPPKVDGDTLSGLATIQGSRERIWLRYRISNEEEKQWLRTQVFAGKLFLLTGTLEKPLHATVENGFDFKKYLYRQGGHWVFQADVIEVVATKRGAFIALAKIREEGMLTIKQFFPEPLSSHALALVFGEQRELDSEQYLSYQRLGIVHLFSISGSHVSVLSVFLFQALLRLGITRTTSMKMIVAVLPLYALLTGFTAPVVRACGMVLLFFLAQLFNRKITAIEAISACLMIYLFFQPYQLFFAGFQLSFAICGGLILSRKIFSGTSQSFFRKAFLGTFICQLVSFPIVLYVFYELSLLGFVANAIYIPLFTFFYFPATLLLYLLFLLLPISPVFLIESLNKAYEGLVFISEKLAAIPFATLLFGRPNQWLLAFLIVVIVLFFLFLEKKSKRLMQVATLVLILLLSAIYHAPLFARSGEVTVLDVGQGDAIFIRLPHGKGDYLIDTGGVLTFEKETWAMKSSTFEPGKDIVVPFLKSKGVRRLDKLLLTHADQDHVGGATAVMTALKVAELVLPIGQEEAFSKKEVLSLAHQLEIPVRQVKAGEKWQVGKNLFQVVHPNQVIEETNDASLTIWAKMGGVNWLFTGDLPIEQEEEILANYPNMKIDVLKVGHHGSHTSTSPRLLEMTQPRMAVISCGRNNRYGHPKQSVLENLESAKVKVFRTDQMGSVQYLFEKEALKAVRWYSP